VTIRTALQQGTKLLEEGAIAAPRLTSEVLICQALRRERAYLYAHPEEELSEVAWIHYGRYLHERLQGKPTQYITGRQEFYGREFRVTPDVLIPRPETEHLISAALKAIHSGDSVLDVGTGSGAIAITLVLESGAKAFATDVSPAALRVAIANAHRLQAPVAFLAADLMSCVAPQSIDVLVSNPPYVPRTDQPVLQREVRDHEPHLALFGGPTGLELYQQLIADAPRVLRPGGRLLLELGYNSLEPVKKMLDSAWHEVIVEHDLAGFPRVLATHRS
jgi:release factor glutamine methyltransferase